MFCSSTVTRSVGMSSHGSPDLQTHSAMNRQEQLPVKENLLTSLELAVMQALWENGDCTVAVVRSVLNQPLAYTTVQTMLNILERKKTVLRPKSGNAHTYRAIFGRKDAQVQELHELVSRLFDGSYEALAKMLRDRTPEV